MATITLITSFPEDVRTAFYAYIHGLDYVNRERIPYEKWRKMKFFLEDPTLKPNGAIESSLKHRALHNYQLIDSKLYRNPTSIYQEPRYVVLESEVLDLIISEHLRLQHAGRDKVWSYIQRTYYGISRQDVIFILKLCKSCALNRPSTTKAPLVPITSGYAWERVQIDLIDMRHEPSGQFKWILHIKDHFSKYTQLYPLKSKHTEPVADAFAMHIAAFLPPKIMQSDNGKEFKGALLILLRKFGIRVINGAPRSPQTQGLVEQGNRVVEDKLRSWKMDHGSTEWANGLLEVTLAINTQKHSTIGCTPAELLFRDHTSHISWLSSDARKNLLIGVEQEDQTLGPILESDLEAHINPRLRTVAPELRIELRSSQPNSEQSSDSELEQTLEPEPELRLQARVETRAQARLQAEASLIIELQSSEPNSERSSCSELEQAPEPEPKLQATPDPIIEQAKKATQKAKVLMMPHGLEYPVNAKDSVVQRGAAAIRRASSVVFIAIEMNMIVDGLSTGNLHRLQRSAESSSTDKDGRVTFSHASFGDFFRDETEGLVSGGQHTLLVGVNIRSARVRVFYACLDIMSCEPGNPNELVALELRLGPGSHCPRPDVCVDKEPGPYRYQDALWHLRLGATLRDLRHYTQALGHFEKSASLVLEKEQWPIQHSKSWLYIEMRKYETAAELDVEIAFIGHSVCYLFLGNYYKLVGRMEDAISQYAEVVRGCLEILDNNDEADDFAAFSVIFQVVASAIRPEEAVNIFYLSWASRVMVAQLWAKRNDIITTKHKGRKKAFKIQLNTSKNTWREESENGPVCSPLHDWYEIPAPSEELMKNWQVGKLFLRGEWVDIDVWKDSLRKRFLDK
ncbi:hypothetical protein V501_04793 [Pseudogymnoascus sp. VKM F-4519 (FW-2642)]|nr:hypothetical protein V501_04793 [Pseudogymnoascus sp. VKM F-4519 (FW-2642)]